MNRTSLCETYSSFLSQVRLPHAYPIVLVATIFVATATPTTFDLSNVSFAGGITATGSFSFDPSTNTLSNLNVTVSGPATGFNGFFAPGPVTFDTVQSNFLAPGYTPPVGDLAASLLPNGSRPDASNAAAQLILLFVPVSLTAPTPLSSGDVYLAIIGNPNFNQSLVSGSLVPQSTSAGACALSVTPLNQTSSPWGGDLYDTATSWAGSATSSHCPQGTKVCIAAWGCNLTSAVMLINYQASQQGTSFATDPETLNTWLETYSPSFSSSGNIWGCDVAEYANQNGVSLFYQSHPCGTTSNPYCTAQDDAIVSSYLCSSNPVVLGVLPPGGGHHFVLATGQAVVGGTNAFTINDPYFGFPTLATYGGYLSIGQYSGTRMSPSQCGGTAGTILITAHSPVELLVTDPSGNRTGLDPIAGIGYSQIPGSAYYTDSVTEDVDPASGATTPVVKNLEILTPVSGSYLIRATGTDNGTYTIDVRSYDSVGALTLETVTGNAAQGVASQLALSYATTPGNPASVMGPYSLCDTNQDGTTNVKDIQKLINETLGALPPADDLNSGGIVNIVDVQTVINAAIGLGCSAT